MIIRKAMRFLLVVLVPSIGFGQATRMGSPIAGDVRPISFQSQTAETNVILATMSAGATADDNINNSVSHPIGGAQYFAAPSLAIQETRSQLKWNLSYRPVLRFYVPRTTHRDLFSQSFGGSLHYDFTKRLAIGLRQDYLRTFDPFQQLGDAPLQSGIGLLNQPGTVALPDVRRTQLLSQIQMDYRLAKHTSLGIAGNFMQLHSDGLGSQRTSLIDARDTSGSAFLSHQFTARQTVGVQYQFLNLVFPGRDSRTTTHGVLLFDQIVISPHLSFVIFGGPEYSRIHNQVLVDLLGVVVHIFESKTLWSPAEGAMLDWSGPRFGVQGSFVQRISDGGGLQGSVEMKSAALHIREKLARRWVVNLNGEMTQRKLLSVSEIGKSQALSLGAEISHELADKIWIRTSYQRMHRIGGYLSTGQFGNHSRVTVILERDFNLPLGR